MKRPKSTTEATPPGHEERLARYAAFAAANLPLSAHGEPPPVAVAEEELLSRREAEAILGVTAGKIKWLVNRGKLRVIKRRSQFAGYLEAEVRKLKEEMQ